MILNDNIFAEIFYGSTMIALGILMLKAIYWFESLVIDAKRYREKEE
jgi:hypothetical protein